MVTARELSIEMQAVHPPVLIDVRPGARVYDRSIPELWRSIWAISAREKLFHDSGAGESGTPLVPATVRLTEATRLEAAAGWGYAANLTGGVLAWVREVDPGLATY